MKPTIEKQWTTEAGLDAVALLLLRENGTRRHRCGYVRVPDGSPLYGKGYGEQLPLISTDTANEQQLGKKSPILLLTAGVGADGDNVRRSLDVVIDVHGGITFDGELKDLPGWWFGFDCAHSGDTSIDLDEIESSYPTDGVARSLEYVVSECESMAKQLSALLPTEPA